MSASAETEDLYLWLEEVESEEALNFAKAANEECLTALGNPKKDERATGTYKRILEVLESDARIPYVTKFGTDVDGETILFNFWKDSTNPKGLWCKTTLAQYRASPKPEWMTVLNVDDLARKDGVSWVWSGSRPLPRSRDPEFSSKMVTRALLSLSQGGSDAIASCQRI